MTLSAQRLSGWILTGVSVFALFVVGVLVIRGYLAHNPGDLPPSKADYRIKEIRLQEQESGRLQWRLVADQAEVFSREGKTVLRKVTVTIEEPDRTWTVTGDEGDLHDATKDVEIRKNVVLTGSDGLRLETTTLRWQAKERRVWTNDPVTIFRDGAVIQGQGLEAWMADERTHVKGRLRVTFAERAQERSQERSR
jgi:LPS export ABC transporter protein LptC